MKSKKAEGTIESFLQVETKICKCYIFIIYCAPEVDTRMRKLDDWNRNSPANKTSKQDKQTRQANKTSKQDKSQHSLFTFKLF